MELKVRQIKSSDWEMLVSWWKGHNWSIINKDALPDNGTGGFIVEENNKPVLAGFLFQTNSKGCWLEFIISDPKYKKDRKKIIEKLVNTAQDLAIKLGYKYMLFIGKSNGLRKVMKELGWFEDPTPTFELMKKIN
tara:strand:+ start:1887 stop:2291 length:405 start_codon:yes stop_codon:yes gene_type:complete